MERLKQRSKAILALSLASIVLLNSCQKDAWFGPINPIQNDSLDLNSSVLYLIGCEGNFQFGNASLSVLNLDSSRIGNEVYAQANNKPLGDILQSITIDDSLIYLVVNNSNKIVGIKPLEWTEQVVFENIPSPRYLLALNSESMLVTSFGASQISIINPKEKNIKGKINAPLWTEHIVKHEDWIIVTSPSDSSVLLIDPIDFNIKHTLKLPAPPKSLIQRQDDLYVIAGNTERTFCMIIKENVLVEHFTLLFQSTASAGNSDGFYFLTPDEIIHTSADGTEINRVFHQMQTPYSLYVDEENLLATDVKDYLSDGDVLHYDMNLEKTSKYQSKLIPQFIAAWRQVD